MNKRIKKKKRTTINDIRRFDDCRNLFNENTTNVSKTYQSMMDHSKQREELKKKLFNDPEFDVMVKGLYRDTEFLNSPHTGTPTLYAEVDEFDIGDPVVISESTAKKMCKSLDNVIRGHRLSDGWENEEFDNARKISNFNETLG